MEYRTILEVAKLCSPFDTLVYIAQVSTDWSRVSESHELWVEFAEGRGFPPRPSKTVTLKDWYHFLHQRAGSIPLVRRNVLTLFNCNRRKWDKKIPLQQSIQADEVSASAMLPDGSLVCCGGGNWKTEENWATAYRILEGGAVQVLQNMLVAREAHGIICFQNVVYVFGGDTDVGPPVMSGEKLMLEDISTLRTRQWSLLPNMLFSHSYFTPVVFQKVFYLCGGYNPLSETFDPVSEKFTAVQLALTEPEHNWCTVYQDNLVIVSGYRMHVLNSSTHRNKLVKRSAPVLDEWSQTPPITVGDVTYRLALNGDVLEANLNTLDLVRVKHPR